MPLCEQGSSTPQPVLKGFAVETLALWQPEFEKRDKLLTWAVITLF